MESSANGLRGIYSCYYKVGGRGRQFQWPPLVVFFDCPLFHCLTVAMLTTEPFKEEMEMPRTWFGSILISPLFLRLFEEIDNVVAPVCALWAGWRSGISCPPFSLGQEKNPPSIARRCTVAHFSVQTCLLKSRYRPPPTPTVPCARTYVDLEATNGRSILIINRSDS